MASVRRINRKRIKSKKHEKEQDEIERLEQEIRELKAINRSLMKQLKKLSKGIHKEEYDNALEEVTNRGKKRQEEPECPECGRAGGLKEISIAGRRFQRCEYCGFKSGRLK